MKFCMRGHLADVINRAKFYLNQIRGFDSVGVNFWLSHRKEKSPLTQGLNYRSACDSPEISHNFAGYGPYFLRGKDPIFKLLRTADHGAKSRGDRPTELGDLATKKRKK